MLTLFLSFFSLVVLSAELWTGIVVIALQGDRLYLERSKTPGQYWIVMSLHLFAGLGLPAFAWMAGI